MTGIEQVFQHCVSEYALQFVVGQGYSPIKVSLQDFAALFLADLHDFNIPFNSSVTIIIKPNSPLQVLELKTL